MSSTAQSMAQRRQNPFTRAGSPSPAPTSNGRPKSAMISSPSPLSSVSTPPSHSRTQSHASIATALVSPASGSRHQRAYSREGTPSSSTFAPSFIKTDEMRRSADTVKGIEGENDFSGKRYVWLKDPQLAFVKGWIVEELGGNKVLVQCDDGSVSLIAVAEMHHSKLKSTKAARSRRRDRRQS
jgi:myosin heavy chain 9/10/11/14